MRQTPFGVWNRNHIRASFSQVTAPMRQTPFGVWNVVELGIAAAAKGVLQ